MASTVLLNPKVYVGASDYSSQLNALALNLSAEMLDATTFGQTTRINTGGVKAIDANLQGLWDATTTASVDPQIFANVGLADVPVSICPTTGAEGEIAFVFRANTAEYEPGAQYGELLGFSVTMNGSGGISLARGMVIRTATITATGNGTAYQVGAVTAGKRMCSALHVLSVSGTNPTLDVVIESDTVGFASATTRMTHAQKTAVGSDFQSVAGAITDDYWRVAATVGGSDTPTFTFVVALGIAH